MARAAALRPRGSSTPFSAFSSPPRQTTGDIRGAAFSPLRATPPHRHFEFIRAAQARPGQSTTSSSAGADPGCGYVPPSPTCTSPDGLRWQTPDSSGTPGGPRRRARKCARTKRRHRPIYQAGVLASGRPSCPRSGAASFGSGLERATRKQYEPSSRPRPQTRRLWSHAGKSRDAQKLVDRNIANLPGVMFSGW